jgi:polar amino acid transport system permease protein
MPEALGYLAFGPTGFGDEIAAGVLVTVSLALVTLPFGLVMGFLVALGRQSADPLIRQASQIYTTIFRGLPELLTLFLVFFIAPVALSATVRLFADVRVEMSPFVAGVLALGFVFSSFASEVFTSAFKGIGIGQYEGATALGLSRWLTMRLVIMPQLLRIALPGLSNLWLVLLKDTSLVSAIAINDIMRQTRVAAGYSKEHLLFYSVALLIYLGLSMISSAGIGQLERWTRRGEAR